MVSAPAVTVGPQRKDSAVVVASAFLLAAIASALGPAVGMVHTFDGSTPNSVPAGVWLVLIPALLAVALAGWRPVLGLVVVAGAGLFTVGRLVADIGVVSDPNNAIRPDLFYEKTAGALPFTVSAGSYLMIAGDIAMVVLGVLTARRLGSLVSLGDGELFEAESRSSAGQETEDASARLLPRRNNPLIFVGFLGVLGLLVGTLSVPYSGGYLLDRPFPPSLGLWSVLAAVLLAAVATGAVLVAAALPRNMALALLGGVAAAAAVPALTALVVTSSGTPLDLRPGAWFVLIGATVMLLAGLLARVRSAPEVLENFDAEPPSLTLRLAGGIAALVAAAGAILGDRLPGLLVGGARDTAADSVQNNGFAFSAPIAAPFAAAALLLAVAGLLTLIPKTAEVGRAVVALAWAPLAYAVTLALVLYSQVISNLVDPTQPSLVTVNIWTLGPGVWSGIAGLVFAVVAAGLAVIASRRSAQTTTVVITDESADRARTLGRWITIPLAVLAVVVGFVPTFYSTNQQSPTLSFYGVDSVGVWFLTVAMIAGVAVAGQSRRIAVILGAGLGAAAVGLVRAVIPQSVHALAGFRLGAGLWAVIALAVLIVVGTVVLAVSDRRITAIDPGADMMRLRNSMTPGRNARSTRPAAATAQRTSGKTKRASTGKGHR